jgi:hypothetical protein
MIDRPRPAGRGGAEGWLARVGTRSLVGWGVQLLITFDHFFAFLSILTTCAPDLSEFHGQN